MGSIESPNFELGELPHPRHSSPNQPQLHVTADATVALRIG